MTPFKPWLKLSTYYKLGFRNILTVAIYRFAKYCGFYKKFYPVGETLAGPFFSSSSASPGGTLTISYFSRHNIEVSSPPDWFLNPWNNIRCEKVDRHWSEIPDFDPVLGDIKTIWELSRFDWLPKMAWQYYQGNRHALDLLELWLRDWAARNPVNGGINWKCGQEASIRCLNMMVAALLIDDRFIRPTKGFLDFLMSHLQRIASTMYYGIAQRNNHGISEAAGLFVAGSYLSVYGNKLQKKKGRKLAARGRSKLEFLIKTLILEDGSFSQYSVNYHRLILDILSLVELLRRRLKSESFSKSYYDRISSAVRWLHVLTDGKTGDGPNLGANDGSYLFNLKRLPYRDFRPTVQLAAAVFLKKAVWSNIPLHALLEIFNIDPKKFPPIEDTGSVLMPNGGYAILKKDNGIAMLRLPVYRFRPSHADGLHLDIWQNGINWVRDSGSFSYHSDDSKLEYFPGTSSHSTISFDKRDQMPRLGRFLFGAWLEPDRVKWDEKRGYISASYKDYLHAFHWRHVQMLPNGWIVIDKAGGFQQEMCLRWHLAPADWKFDSNRVFCREMEIIVAADKDLQLSLVMLPESRFYLEHDNVPVLEINSVVPCTIETRFLFKK